MMKALTRGGMTAGLAIALSGCLSLSVEPPESLLTLTSTVTVPAGASVTSTADNAIKIIEPEAPQKLNVTRVPVQVDATEIAYLENAVWVERPTRLFRRLLAETLRARTNRLVIDGDDPRLVAKSQLRGTLRDFGYDARSSSVIVRFDAIRATGLDTVETKRFESIQPGVAAEAAPVGTALNRGANDVAGQVAEWLSED